MDDIIISANTALMTFVSGPTTAKTLTTEMAVHLNETNGTEIPKYEPIVDPSMHLVRIICEVFISLPIAVLGIIGNLLAFVVLCKQQRLTTTVLLQGLAVADTLVLVSSILLRSMRYVGLEEYNKFYDYIFVALYPCVFFFRLADTWLTVMLTIDRYIAVCHPLQAQRICTLRRTYISITTIILSTLIFSLPRFFEFRYTTEDGPKQGFVPTPFSRGWGYTVAYKIVLFFLVMYLIPMIVLIVLNIRLMNTLRKAYAHRLSMISNGSIQNGQKALVAGQRVSRGVTIIVATVVTVCVVCNITAMMAHVLWSLQMCHISLRFLEYYRRFLANVSNVMVTLNCAVNFIIYCMFSRSFRAGLQQTCKCEKSTCVSCRHQWRSDQQTDSSGPGNTSYSSLGRTSVRKYKFSIQQKPSSDV